MKKDLMGLKINTETKARLLEELRGRIASSQKTFITTPYSEFFYYAAHDYSFKQIINSADFALPDGIGVLWLAYYLSIPLTLKNYYPRILQAFWQMLYSGAQIIFQPKEIHSVIPEKISGSDFFWDLVKLAAEQNKKIFLLGGFNNTPEIVKQKILSKFPGAIVAGISNAGPKEQGIAAQINNSGTDILFVAYGPVTQEKWIAENWNKLNMKLAIGVGGTFDYIAGKKNNPPKWVRTIGLEWLFRLVTQPKRFKRIWNGVFRLIMGAVRHKVYDSYPFRENVAGVIINKEKKIFIAQRSNAHSYRMEAGAIRDYWQLPQGGVEPNESLEQGLLREMKEETGMDKLKILGRAESNYSYEWSHFIRPVIFSTKGLRRFKGQKQTIFFLEYYGDGSDLKLDQDEFNEYKWISPAQLKEFIHPVRREMLEMALKDLPKYL